MTDSKQIAETAYHAEKVASRRLAIKKSITPEQALRQILELAAGSADISQLLASRKAQALADVKRLAARRQNKCDARAIKLNKNQVATGSWQAWFDGSARPNPGKCGIGAVLKGPNGEQFDVCLAAGYGNSSEAEYLALIMLLEKAIEVKASPLVIYGDSQVVIGDVMGSCKFAAMSLAPSRVRALSLMTQLIGVSLCWIPRHKNNEADALSQRATRLDAIDIPHFLVHNAL